jgi:uncharacterized protein (DUF697 family)
MTRKAARADWTVVPESPTAIEAIAARCRKLVTKRALVAAGVAMVPMPGVDWVTDVGMLVKLLPEINEAFGLTPSRSSAWRRTAAWSSTRCSAAGGGMLVGRVVTQKLVMLPAEGGRRAADRAAGRQVRADRRAGRVGRADLFGPEVRLRAAHPAMHRRVRAAAVAGPAGHYAGLSACRQARAHRYNPAFVGV